MTQPRQYLHDTLRDLAEDLHGELIWHPKFLDDVSLTVGPKLKKRGAKISVREFIRKFTDLFKLVGDRPVVHALVLSHPARAKTSAEAKEVKPIKRSEPPGRNFQEGGSSGSNEPLAPANPASSSSVFTPAQLKRNDPVSAHIMNYERKRTPAEIAAQQAKKTQAQLEKERKQNERLDRSVELERQRQQKQLEQYLKRNR